MKIRILMMTNTYVPHVGGVARSVKQFTEDYRRLGHPTLVVAPLFQDTPQDEPDVVRVPALRNFIEGDFSVTLPVPKGLNRKMNDFAPDIIHSHHPFLLGDTAIRMAASHGLPILFTHHTMYEKYTHYVTQRSEDIKEFVKELATGYANLCDHVIAPSESVHNIIQNRGVTSPITVIPTGVDVDRFESGRGQEFRNAMDLGEDSFVVGHVGRLAPEKNLRFLSRCVARFLYQEARRYFLVVGDGPSTEDIREVFEQEGVSDRLRLAGEREGQELVNAYHAMDLFAFASQTETQGMVLLEAMAAGLPVVALDAPGAREMVEDGKNGRLVASETIPAFHEAMGWYLNQTREDRQSCREWARKKAHTYSRTNMARRALELYEEVIDQEREPRDLENTQWKTLTDRIEREWQLWNNFFRAAIEAVRSE